jgi:3-deoxy-D-manno-octulosonate 8-phosphate phosphatase (KDO 8-P phosphatase)
MQVDLRLLDPQRISESLPEGLRHLLSTLTVIAMDVDGVLTDANRVIGQTGNNDALMFNVRDGLGIALLLRAGLRVVWVSARESAIISRRANELGLSEVHLGITRKETVLRSLRSSTAGTIAYIGDDIWDLEAFDLADVTFAVRDAHWRLARAAMVVTSVDGGHGAVREIADLVLAVKGVDAIALLHSLEEKPDGGIQEDLAIRERTREMYDRAAVRYLEAFGKDKSDAQWLVGFCERVVMRSRAKGKRPIVLDIGSGPATYSKMLQDHGVDSFGLDVSHQMLLRGKSHAPGWRAVQADMTQLPFQRTKSLHGALIAYSLLHLPNHAAMRCLDELHRILETGCPVLLLLKEGVGSDWIDASLVPGEKMFVKFWDAKEAQTMLTNRGFVVETVATNVPTTPEEIQRPKIALFARTA